MQTRDEALLTIAAVERDTGIAKDTLRVWERRYGFPQPQRDHNGDRRYPAHQVEKLKVLRRLLEQGFRPGRIIAASLAELSELAGGEAYTGEVPTADATEILALLRAHQADLLRERLQQLLARQGLERFVLDTLAPLNTVVGQAWMRGDLAVYEEHVYSELVQGILRATIGGLSGPRAQPRLLLSTLPGEEHALGLLMVEAMATLEGVSCLSLGVQTPVEDIVAAARGHRIDVVALSFSSAFGTRRAKSALYDVRARLPRGTELWTGGSAVAGMRRPPPGVLVVRGLRELPPAIARWREHSRAALPPTPDAPLA